MSAERRIVSPLRLLAMVIVFSLLGPIVWALLFVVLFGTFGIVTMGPFAIFAGLMYFFWWLPSIYAVFGPPFLLTGILYAFAVRTFAPESLVSALLAAIVAFSAYLGVRYWVMGSLDTVGSRLGPNALSDPWGVATLAIVGVLPCWWLLRDRDSALVLTRSTPPGSSLMPSGIRNNAALLRFELDAGGHTAVAYYQLAPGVITFTHTEVPPAMRGRGIASALVHDALEVARAQGLKVVAKCAFVCAYIGKHREFADLLL